MTTPSPLVLINSTPQINGVNVPRNSTVTVALASNAGVYTWDIICIGTDEHNVASSVNATVSINHAINTATFTVPDGYGQAFIFQSIVNNGVDVNGVVQSTYATTFGVYVLCADAATRVGAQNETVEGSATYGWITKFNPIFRNIPVLTEQIIANIQLVPHDGYILPNTLYAQPQNQSASIQIWLPNPAPPIGSVYMIADSYYLGTANNITIGAPGATIDGHPSGYTISTNNGAVAVIYLGPIFGFPEYKILWTKV